MTCNFVLLNSDKTGVLLIGPKTHTFRRMYCYFILYNS